MAKRTHREEAVDWLVSNDRWLTCLPKELASLHKYSIQHDDIIRDLCAILREFVNRVRRLEEELAEHRHPLPEDHVYVYPPDLNFLIDSRKVFYQSLFGRLEDTNNA
jgi:hypothetical protein